MKSPSRVRLFVTPWNVAYQSPQSMEFSSKNTGVGCHFLLQGLFPTQGSNPGLPHCRQTLYPLSHQGSHHGISVFIKGVSQVALVVKNPSANAGDGGLVSGSGRSPGGGHSNSFQYSCLENPTDRGASRARSQRV